MTNKEKYFILKQAFLPAALIGGSIGAATKDEGEGTGKQFARGAGVGVMTDAGLGLGGLAGAGVGAGAGYGIGKLIDKLQGHEPTMDEYGVTSSSGILKLLTAIGGIGGGVLGAGAGSYGGYRLGRKMMMPYSKKKEKKEEKDKRD
jgi:hypothetical protein